MPAKRTSDGVLGLYDLVTKQFYTNNGTGTFIAGPEKVRGITINTKDKIATHDITFKIMEELEVPKQSKVSYIYDGTEKTLEFDNISGHVTITGNKATEPGTYTCTVTPDENCYWADGTTSAREYEWKIVSIDRLLNFTAEEVGSTIGLAKKNSTSTLQYSADGVSNWTELTTTDTITLSNIGDKVYFRGEIVTATVLDYTQFSMTGRIAAGGSIMSILCDDPYSVTLPYEWCCCGMFFNCTSLTHAPELPATTLADRCYSNMFEGCINLT